MASVYKIVTDQIIDALKAGVVPWHKPWSSIDGFRNIASNRPYRGINVWLLAAAQAANNWSDSRWITPKEAQRRGGTFAGQKTTMVVFWKPISTIRQTEDGVSEEMKGMLLRYYRVFNVEQISGIELPPIAEPKEVEPIATAQAIFDGMPNRPPITYSGDRAFYVPSLDTITLPPIQAFESPETFYETAFHELSHSTGHSSRLDRHVKEDMLGAFGSAPYSREELVAEMSASFLMHRAGIFDHTMQNSAAYIGSWLRQLQGDEKMVITAAAQAQKAAEYILNEKASEPTDEES